MTQRTKPGGLADKVDRRFGRGYDSKCYETAEYFLADLNHTEDQVAELAQEIQNAVENYCSHHWD